MYDPNHPLGLDQTLRGAEAICHFRKDRNVRATYHALKSGWIPFWKEGATVCSTPRLILQRQQELAGQQPAAA